MHMSSDADRKVGNKQVYVKHAGGVQCFSRCSAPLTVTHDCAQVLQFSKSNTKLFGYFCPEKMFLDEEDK